MRSRYIALVALACGLGSAAANAASDVGSAAPPCATLPTATRTERLDSLVVEVPVEFSHASEADAAGRARAWMTSDSSVIALVWSAHEEAVWLELAEAEALEEEPGCELEILGTRVPLYNLKLTTAAGAVKYQASGSLDVDGRTLHFGLLVSTVEERSRVLWALSRMRRSRAPDAGGTTPP